MKFTARGGTDAAQMVLFWPELLPVDADTQLKDNPIGLCEKLREEGKLIWFPCEGDGSYSLAVYLREPIPEELAKLCTEEEHIPQLIAKGTGYFHGIEHMFKNDSSFPVRTDALAEQLRIPAGVYSARVFRTASTEKLYESWLIEKVGVSAKRWWDFHSIIIAWAVAGVFCMAFAFFFVSWLVWYCIAAITCVFIGLAVTMSRTEWYRKVAESREEYNREFPSYVVHLE